MIFSAKKKYSDDIVTGTLDRPKMYDKRRFILVKVYNETKTHYRQEKIEVEPTTIIKKEIGNEDIS